MATVAFERRVRALEKAVGVGACTNPDHGDLMWIRPDHQAEDEARLESMKRCQKCSDKRILTFITNVPDDED